MSVKITTDFNKAVKRLSDSQERGLFILSGQVLADSTNYVPELSGDLKRYATIGNNNKTITWNQPYARFQYYGVGFKNYTKPGTGPRWDQVAKSRHLSDWLKIVREEYKR